MAKPSLAKNPLNDYVYEILVGGIVRYVGKGRGVRAKSHVAMAHGINRRREAGELVRTQKFYNRLAKALKLGQEVSIRIIAEGLTSPEAFALEIDTIASHSGLWNELPGGQGADSRHFKRIWESSEGRAKYLAAMTSPQAIQHRKSLAELQWADQGARDKNRARTKSQWEDKQFRIERLEKIRSAITPERRKDAAEKQRQLWADPEFRKKQTERIREALAEPDQKARQKLTGKKFWDRPDAAELRDRMNEARRNSPAFKAAMKSPERIAKMAVGQKKSWDASPERKMRQSEFMKRLWAERKTKCSG